MGKLTFLLLFVACLTASAKGYSQISMVTKNAPLETVLKQFEKKTGYSFMYRQSQLENAVNVTVDLDKATLEEALKQIFKDQPLNYTIQGKLIVLSEKKAAQLSAIAPAAPPPPVDVKGRVVNEKGEPLAGVSVLVKGTKRGTSTNENGEFEIRGLNEDAVLQFSGVNIEAYETKLNGRSELSFTAKAKISQLQDVIVSKGYYTTSQRLNTGTVSTVKGADIAKQPVNNLLAALEGRVSGLYISQFSGVPGSAVKVMLRGQNSIANGNDPLYLVDGIPYPSTPINQVNNAASSGLSPLANINPGDIESIDVLKDADATAIYGSRGANGVILITTKKGKAGKTKFDASINTGTGKITRKLELLNTQQYVEMRLEAFKNDNTTPTSTDYDVNGTWDKTKYTDWQDLLIGNTAKYTNAQISLSGGSELTQFLLSGNYRKETTVFPGDNTTLNGSGNFNLTHQSENKRFKINLNILYNNNSNVLPRNDLTQNIFIAPNAPSPYTPTGEINWENNTFSANPFALLLRSSKITTESLINSIELSYQLLRDVKIRGVIGYNSIRVDEVNLSPLISFVPNGTFTSTSRSNFTGTSNIKNWLAEPQIEYSRNFGKHHIEVLIGSSFQEKTQSSNRIQASNFINDVQIKNISAASTITVFAANTQYKYNAIFGRLGYNYDSRYVFNLTGRRDGSSRFGPENQFGNFGSAGVAWVISKEKFFEKVPSFLSFAKVKASLGRTGNDQLPDYQYLSTYLSGSSYLGATTLNPSSLSNPSYGWEIIDKKEVGFELGMLKDKIFIEGGWYQHRTKNQLVGYPLSSVTGFTSVFTNLPAVVENRGLEFSANTLNLNTSNFKWTSNFNISFPKNKLISYPGIAGSSYANRYIVGEPIFIRRILHYLGVDPATGVHTYQDINKDGIISSPSDNIPLFIGQKYFGGINNTLTFKGLTLDVFVQFVKQTGSAYLLNASPGYFGQAQGNQPINVLDRWRNSGDVTTVAQYTQQFTTIYNGNSLLTSSDATVVDASFVRLKNVSVAYEFPMGFKKKIHLQTCKVFVQGQNLLTITKFKGADPENNTQGVFNLPPLRMFTAGLQINL